VAEESAEVLIGESRLQIVPQLQPTFSEE
jgi:hypothetical protein